MTADNPERIRIKIKRLLKSLNQISKFKIREFKFSADNDDTRYKMLNLMARLDMNCGSIIVKKAALSAHSRSNISALYNTLVAKNIIHHLITSYEKITYINLHLDASMSKDSRQEFNVYFSNELLLQRSEYGIHDNIISHIQHAYSNQEGCIQAADYLTGSLYRLHQHNDARYYEMIKHKVISTYGWGIDT